MSRRRRATPAGLQGDATILRQALLGDIETGHDLDARDEGGGEFARWGKYFNQVAIDPIPDRQFVLERIDMNVGCATLHRFVDEAVDQTDDRRLVDVVDQAFESAPAGDGGFDICCAERALAERDCQRAIETGRVKGFDRVRAPERAARLDQGHDIGTRTNAHRQRVAIRQHDEPFVLGEGIGELAGGCGVRAHRIIAVAAPLTLR